MFDPIALMTVPFADRIIPAPDPAGPGMPVLRARPSAAIPQLPWLCEQGAKPLHDALVAQGARVWPDLTAEGAPKGPFPAAGVAMTRHKTENRANLARAWDMVEPGGWVLIAGTKTDGVESLQKDLRKLVDLDGVLPRNHGRVMWMQRTANTPPTFAEWLADAARAPRIEDEARHWTTEAGLFSWTEVDPGSRLLIEHMPPLSGRVADLGAGWGWLSAHVLGQIPVKRVDLYESEATALACARANINDERAHFVWADVAAHGAVPPRTYDRVIANPPFHEGRNVAMGLGQSFVAAAAQALKPSGSLYMVANLQLPYEREIEALFTETTVLARTPRYKVLHGARPRRRPVESGGAKRR
jgi:16S rRNA (guanine1207-N2)-methyltransferase